MSDTLRGEVVREIGGEIYRFKMSFNAMCDLEEVTGKTLAEVVAEMEINPSITTMRALFWAALQEHHAGFTIKDVGDLMQELGAAFGDLAEAIFAAADFVSGEEEDGAAAASGGKTKAR